MDEDRGDKVATGFGAEPVSSAATADKVPITAQARGMRKTALLLGMLALMFPVREDYQPNSLRLGHSCLLAGKYCFHQGLLAYESWRLFAER